MKKLNEFINEASGDFAGWIAGFNGKQIEITKDKAKDLWGAKQIAIKELKVPKSKEGLLWVKPAVEESLKEDSTEQLNESAEGAKVIKALADLEKAFQNLAVLWIDGNDDTIYNEILVQDYPFKSSFDELNLDVRDWVKEATKEIKKLK